MSRRSQTPATSNLRLGRLYGSTAVEFLIGVVGKYPQIYNHKTGDKPRFSNLPPAGQRLWKQVMKEMQQKYEDVTDEIVWNSWRSITLTYHGMNDSEKPEKCLERWIPLLEFLNYVTLDDDDAEVPVKEEPLPTPSVDRTPQPSSSQENPRKRLQNPLPIPSPEGEPSRLKKRKADLVFRDLLREKWDNFGSLSKGVQNLLTFKCEMIKILRRY